jgi:hypothetical protein
MTTPKHTTAASTTTPDVATQATEALASLKTLTASLPIDDAIPDNQMAATRVTGRVPLAAMSIAAGVLADSPEQFPQFDATDAQGALDYEEAMVPVARAALVLSNRITKSVLKRRSGMAHQTLALYLVMKGASRLAENEGIRTHVKEMRKLFTTKTKSRETEVSQSETAAMVKTRKSEKKEAAAQAKADAASNDLAIVSAQTALDTAVATGTLPAPRAPATSAPVTVPEAPTAVNPGH